MNGILSRLRWIFSPRDKKMFLLLAVLMAFSALLEMAGLGMLVGAAALFLSPENPAAQQLNDISRNCLPGIPENWCIAAAISAVALLLIGKNIFAFAIIRLQIKFTTGIQQNLAERLFNVYLHARNEEFSKLAPAECINHISRVYNLCNQILMPAMQMLADILVVITVTLAALILFPGVTLLSTLFMAATAGTLSKLTKKANMRAGKNFLEAELKENKIRHLWKKEYQYHQFRNFFCRTIQQSLPDSCRTFRQTLCAWANSQTRPGISIHSHCGRGFLHSSALRDAEIGDHDDFCRADRCSCPDAPGIEPLSLQPDFAAAI